MLSARRGVTYRDASNLCGVTRGFPEYLSYFWQEEKIKRCDEGIFSGGGK